MGQPVFISYSHDSDAHVRRVQKLADRLRADGVDCRLDMFLSVPPPQGWTLWVDQEIATADAVLVIFTERYARKAQEAKRAGASFESVLFLQERHDTGIFGEKLVPVVFDDSDAQHIVKWLRSSVFYNVADQSGYAQLLRRLTRDVRKNPPRQTGSIDIPPRPMRADIDRERAMRMREMPVSTRRRSFAAANSLLLHNAMFT